MDITSYGPHPNAPTDLHLGAASSGGTPEWMSRVTVKGATDILSFFSHECTHCLPLLLKTRGLTENTNIFFPKDPVIF